MSVHLTFEHLKLGKNGVVCVLDFFNIPDQYLSETEIAIDLLARRAEIRPCNPIV